MLVKLVARRWTTEKEPQMARVAVITGASQGLGFELAKALASGGWSLVIDARDATRLDAAATAVRANRADGTEVVAVPGDIADAHHRHVLADHARALGTV